MTYSVIWVELATANPNKILDTLSRIGDRQPI